MHLERRSKVDCACVCSYLRCFFALLCFAEDCMKLDFVLAAMDQPDPFKPKVSVPPDIRAAIEWHKHRSVKAVMREREQVMQRLEAKAAEFR